MPTRVLLIAVLQADYGEDLCGSLTGISVSAGMGGPFSTGFGRFWAIFGHFEPVLGDLSPVFLPVGTLTRTQLLVRALSVGTLARTQFRAL
jgi:hypothetical protein